MTKTATDSRREISVLARLPLATLALGGPVVAQSLELGWVFVNNAYEEIPTLGVNESAFAGLVLTFRDVDRLAADPRLNFATITNVAGDIVSEGVRIEAVVGDRPIFVPSPQNMGLLTFSGPADPGVLLPGNGVTGWSVSQPFPNPLAFEADEVGRAIVGLWRITRLGSSEIAIDASDVRLNGGVFQGTRGPLGNVSLSLVDGVGFDESDLSTSQITGTIGIVPAPGAAAVVILGLLGVPSRVRRAA